MELKSTIKQIHDAREQVKADQRPPDVEATLLEALDLLESYVLAVQQQQERAIRRNAPKWN